MFLNAATTASVQNRQDSVRRSKYPKYSRSGGTKKQVIAAAAIATSKTTLLFKKCMTIVRVFLRAGVCADCVSEAIFRHLPCAAAMRLCAPIYYTHQNESVNKIPEKLRISEKNARKIARRADVCYNMRTLTKEKTL